MEKIKWKSSVYKLKEGKKMSRGTLQKEDTKAVHQRHRGAEIIFRDSEKTKRHFSKSKQ